jgi:peptidoglycan/LPS O-acetylase OafA/YrhL
VEQSTAMSPLQWGGLTAAACTLLLTLVYRDAVFRETIRYSMQGLALMPIFYFAIRFSDNLLFRTLNLSLAVTLGTYSYAIYLIHYVVLKSMVKELPAISGKSFILFSSVMLISIAYAAIIDHFIDPYFRRLRRKYAAKEVAAS